MCSVIHRIVLNNKQGHTPDLKPHNGHGIGKSSRKKQLQIKNLIVTKHVQYDC